LTGPSKPLMQPKHEATLIAEQSEGKRHTEKANLADPLCCATVGTAILLTALFLTLNFFTKPEAIYPEVAWLATLIHSFLVLATLSIAFFALLRYQVLRDPASYWIGTGFAGYGVGLLFYTLCFPGVLRDGGSLLARLPGTAAWVVTFDLSLLGAFLLAAVLSRWPGNQALAGRRWLWTVAACVGLVSLVSILFIACEQYLPPLVAPSGAFTPLLFAWQWGALLAFGVGAILSIRRYLFSRDALLGYASIFQVAYAFAMIALQAGGRRYDVWWFLARMVVPGGAITMMFGLLGGYVRLYTERRQKEQQLQKSNRTLRALTNVNQAMLHATDEAALLQQVCNIINEDCGYAMVWTGFAEDDTEKTVKPVAHAGFEESYLETLRLTWGDSERNRGLAGTAIRTGQPSYCRNILTDPHFEPWRIEALKRGYASALVLPLMEGEKAFGAIVVYSREPDAFSEDEVKLLAELSADLAYGINTLRVRATRERTEQALRESEERFRALVTASSDAMYRMSPDWREMRYFRGGNFISDTETPSRTWLQKYVHPDDQSHVIKVINESIRTKSIFELEHRALRVDGSLGWTFSRAIPLQDANGEIKEWFGAASDVTQRKRIEQELVAAKELAEESLAQFRGTIDSMSEGLYVIDTDGNRLLTNPAYLRIHGFDTGCSPQFAASISPLLERYDCLKGTLLAPEQWPVSRALRGETVVQFQQRVRRKDTGREVIVSVNATPVRDRAGKILMAVVTIQDITASKQAEQALIRSEKLASVGRMAASIAHEINNPLAAVTNALFLARTNADDAASLRQYLDLADDELKRVSHIARQTLGFYRESSAPAPVSVSSVMDAAVDLLRGKIKVKRAVIEKQYDGDFQVTGVPGELRQVFSNLLTNSLDAIGEDGTIKLRVSMATCVNDGQPRIRVTVADNGTGIAAAALPRIFEPLFTTKESTGSGLGLWVSKQLIEKHGASIRVRSRTNRDRRGTVFSIVLPVEPGAAARSQSAGV